MSVHKSWPLTEHFHYGIRKNTAPFPCWITPNLFHLSTDFILFAPHLSDIIMLCHDSASQNSNNFLVRFIMSKILLCYHQKLQVLQRSAGTLKWLLIIYESKKKQIEWDKRQNRWVYFSSVRVLSLIACSVVGVGFKAYSTLLIWKKDTF